MVLRDQGRQTRIERVAPLGGLTHLLGVRPGPPLEFTAQCDALSMCAFAEDLRGPETLRWPPGDRLRHVGDERPPCGGGLLIRP